MTISDSIDDYSEEDTKAKLIYPKLTESGWDEDRIRREVNVTDGTILDEKGNRDPPKEADYVLYHGGLAIAIVEAKKASIDHLQGMKQAKIYCKSHDCLFAYASNGKLIEEFDFTTKQQTTIDAFPTPYELEKRAIEGRHGKLTHNPFKQSTYTGKFNLRYYQDVAIKRILNAFLENKTNNFLVAMATGSGKTKVAFQTAWKLYQSKTIQKVLFITDRNFLISNAVDEFEPFFNLGVADIIGQKGFSIHNDIHFATYQSLYGTDPDNREFKKFDSDYFDFIIIDECHRSGFGTWKAILKRFGKAKVLGMTATPKRSDNIDTFKHFGEPIFEYSLSQGIEDGFLAPYRINKIFTNIDAQGGLSIKQAIKDGAKIHASDDATIKDWYNISELWRTLILPDRTEAIANHLADLLFTYGPMDKTMIFCITQSHARLVAKILQNKFAHLGYDNYAVTIVSEEKGIEEDYANFKDPEKKLPVVATTVDLLSTGVDVPSVKNIVFLKPVASKIVFKQIVGRGCRINNLTGKYEFRIIDYSNATRLFDEWDKLPVPLILEPTGERKYFLKGKVVDKESGNPIPNAKILVKLGLNEEAVVKTNVFGEFKLENIPSQVKITVNAESYRSLTIDTPAYKKDAVEIIIELETKPKWIKPIIIDNLPVWIEKEVFIEMKDGERVTKAQYIEYTKKQVRQRIVDLNDLRRVWTNQIKREEFTKDLIENSVNPKALSTLMDEPDADPFDILAHIAFGAPIISREQRAESFEIHSKKFVKSMGEDGQKIILALLERYRVTGIENIVSKNAFDMPPFDQMGHVVGVAKKVGGIDNLKKMISQIESGLYKYE